MSLAVSLIYLNYNSAQLTLDCIKSFYSVYSGAYSYEVIVLDNASSEKDVALLKSGLTHGEIFIETGGNLGTSKAWNIGARHAKGKYLFYVNSDMLFLDDSVGILKNYMDRHAECGVCGGNLYSSDLKPTFSYYKKFDAKYCKHQKNAFLRSLYYLFRYRHSLEFNRAMRELEVDFVSGANMLIRKTAFEQVGGFDENIFMYAEEADLQYQIRKSGYKVVNVPEAKMIHFEGDTFKKDNGGFSEFRLVQSLMGTAYYFKKNYSDKAAKDYIKATKKSFKIKKIIYSLCFSRSKVEFCKKSIECIDKNFSEYKK